MRIVIESPREGEEEEIVIRCREPDDELMELIRRLVRGRDAVGSARVSGYGEKGIKQLRPADIFYFESVDSKVFAYCEREVFEVKEKLYELEKRFGQGDFQRISKSVIVNISVIDYVSPMLGSRLEAALKNGERVIISRQYVPELKKKLGISER